jgi:hypothetical protein
LQSDLPLVDTTQAEHWRYLDEIMVFCPMRI